MSKPIKYAIHCGIPIAIYKWNVGKGLLYDAAFGDLKSFIYKPHKDSGIEDEFAYGVNDPNMYREITKEQYNKYMKDGTKFDVECNEI